MADLSSKVNGITFRNPVMPAAGPNVKTARLMIDSAGLGAGAIVSKTFSMVPASDPRPTIKKTVGGGLLNCETWLEDSWEIFFDELRQLENRDVPLIVSIGYSPDDVKFLGKMLEQEIKPDLIEFSTHYTGKDLSPLLNVASTLKNEVSVPVWIKLSPGFPMLDQLVEGAESIVDGFVAVNSMGPALDFDPVKCKPSLGSDWGQGWLSGTPLQPIALGIVYRLSQMTDKPIVGVGGISSGIDAVKFMMAGASLVQVCTAAIKEGPSCYGRIANELNDWLDSNGYNNIGEIIGKYRPN